MTRLPDLEMVRPDMVVPEGQRGAGPGALRDPRQVNVSGQIKPRQQHRRESWVGANHGNRGGDCASRCDAVANQAAMEGAFWRRYL
jgi:hypothetical protein